MDHVEDLLAAGALSGQDRPWRENLVGGERRVELMHGSFMAPPVGGTREFFCYHGAYGLYCRRDRRGRQAGLGTAGCRVDCGARL